MSGSKYRFDELFRVADTVIFDRVYTRDDFESFAQLSGDRNRLHHDQAYASNSKFAKPIVPLHLSLAPLSRIAGMVFPGESSLYLGHKVTAVKPVYFDETITYSARIESIQVSQRILELRVIALRGAQVVLDARMRTQAREAAWDSAPSLPILHADNPGCALVTAAAGAIGSATALKLARAGWSLIVHVRAQDERSRVLAATLDEISAEYRLVEADLTKSADCDALVTAANRPDLTLVVHTASPPVSAESYDLIEVNVTALNRLVDGLLRNMLLRQHGLVLGIGSTSVQAIPEGWEAYAGAKAMQANYLDNMNRRYEGYGVTFGVVAFGFVDTPFSQAFRSPDDPALLPGEAAESLVSFLEDRKAGETYRIVDVHSAIKGRFGFSPLGSELAAHPKAGRTNKNDGAAADPAMPVAPPSADAEAQVEQVVREVLNLGGDYGLSGAGLGITPNWDSLRQIEIVLELEDRLGIRFTAADLERSQRMSQLVTVCRTLANQ